MLASMPIPFVTLPPPTARRTAAVSAGCRPRAVEIAALQSGGPRGRRGPPPDPDWSTGEASDTEDQTGAPLRGWDVLHALRRAAVQKGGAARKAKKRRPTDARGEELVDVGYVRPIQVRSDWEARIDELDRKLQQLRSQYHY